MYSVFEMKGISVVVAPTGRTTDHIEQWRLASWLEKIGNSVVLLNLTSLSTDEEHRYSGRNEAINILWYDK